jgi:hypothetical protein
VGNAAHGWLSQQEERAHFALWALLKSPLFVGADLRVLPPSSLAVLTSKEVIAVNQDPLGVPGDLIWKQGPKEVSGRKGEGVVGWGGGNLRRLAQAQAQAEQAGAAIECICTAGRCSQVYAAPLADGGRAAVLHNRHSILSQARSSHCAASGVGE